MDPLGLPQQRPDGEYFRFHGSGRQLPKCQCHCKSSHRQYISTRAWPVPLKLYSQKQAIVLAQGVGLVSLCLLPQSLCPLSGSNSHCGLPGALSPRDMERGVQAGSEWVPVEHLRGPFPGRSASAIIFICLKTQAREY